MTQTATATIPELLPLAGKRVLVLGLGRFGGGVGATRFCAAQGAEVLVTDQKPAERLAEALADLKDTPHVRYRLGRHTIADFTNADLIVVNPAVPPTHPLLQAAVKKGIPTTSEMNLFLARCPGKIVGITGSNGKTTTATLAAHLLSGSGRRVWLGGNLGVSLLEQVESIGRSDAVVLELSSFMLEGLHRLKKSPTVSVITNLSINHLDRHGSLDGYLAAKLAIVAYQKPRDIAVLNFEDLRVQQLCCQVPSRLAMFSAVRAVRPGGFIRGKQFCVDLGAGAKPVGELRSLPLMGAFNHANALAAIVAASVLKTPPEEIARLLPLFRPVRHRLELLGIVDGVTFVNDSVATTPESTIAGLSAFHKPVWLIVGGSDKGLDYHAWAQAVLDRSVAGVLGIGTLGPALVELVRARNKQRRRPKSIYLDPVGDLDGAFATLTRVVEPGEIVLLSPGTASYDQFANFAERGDAFRARVQVFQRGKTFAFQAVSRRGGGSVSPSRAQPARAARSQPPPGQPEPSTAPAPARVLHEAVRTTPPPKRIVTKAPGVPAAQSPPRRTTPASGSPAPDLEALRRSIGAPREPALAAPARTHRPPLHPEGTEPLPVLEEQLDAPWEDPFGGDPFTPDGPATTPSAFVTSFPSGDDAAAVREQLAEPPPPPKSDGFSELPASMFETAFPDADEVEEIRNAWSQVEQAPTLAAPGADAGGSDPFEGEDPFAGAPPMEHPDAGEDWDLA